MKQNKKFYEEPSFEIYVFNMESILTLSGETTGMNNSESDFSELQGIEVDTYGL